MARRRRRDEEEDEDGDSPAAPKKPKPRNDAYVGMLAITFVSLVASAVLFYLDFDSLSGQQIQEPNFVVPPLGGR
jgi:hypothetical protein